MRLALLLAPIALMASTALAYDLTGVQQLLNNPAVQQQAAQVVASNPQLATTAGAGMAEQFLANLTPAQQQQLTAQFNAIAAKVLTPAENAKLTQFQTSPEGAGVIAKMPAIIEQFAPVLMQMYLSQTSQIAPSVTPAPNPESRKPKAESRSSTPTRK